MSIFGKKPDQQSNATSTPPESTSTPSPGDTERRVAPEAKPEPAPTPQKASTPGGNRSYLGAGCEFVGDLSGDGSFEFAGDFEGTIDISGDLVIAHGGTAKAELKARRITIEGRLLGNATGTKKVEVGAVGHVEGDVRAPAVQFAEGAFFEGNVEMRRSPGSAKSAGDGGGSAGKEPTGQGDEPSGS